MLPRKIHDSCCQSGPVFIRLFRSNRQVFRAYIPVDMNNPWRPEIIPADIDGNPGKPAFLFCLIAQAVQMGIGFQKSLLHSVFCLFMVMQIKVTDSQDVFLVLTD